MKWIFLIFFAFFVVPICSAKHNVTSKSSNHPYSKVEISKTNGGCSFHGSPVDYCDDRHIAAINEAILSQSPNFNGHYVLLSVPERENYYQSSLVAIDSNTGIVYPLPIDFYSGHAGKKGGADNLGKLTYSLDSNNVCIDGSIFVYRAEEDGIFCFSLQGDRFTGHHTTYMDEDQ